MMPLTEIIVWTPCSAALPDCDTNVLLYSAETETVFEGWLDADDNGAPLWRDVEAMPVELVTHWADMPAGPAA